MMTRRERIDPFGPGGNGPVVAVRGRGLMSGLAGSCGFGEPRTGPTAATTGSYRARGASLGGTWNMRMVVDWPSMAACRNGDPDALFVQGAEQNVAKRICRGCPVRYEC